MKKTQLKRMPYLFTLYIVLNQVHPYMFHGKYDLQNFIQGYNFPFFFQITISNKCGVRFLKSAYKAHAYDSELEKAQVGITVVLFLNEIYLDKKKLIKFANQNFCSMNLMYDLDNIKAFKRKSVFIHTENPHNKS